MEFDYNEVIFREEKMKDLLHIPGWALAEQLDRIAPKLAQLWR